MMRRCFASIATMALSVMVTVPAMAYTGQELSKQAKVSIAEARAIALKAHPQDPPPMRNWKKKKAGPAFAIRSTSSEAELREKLGCGPTREGFGKQRFS